MGIAEGNRIQKNTIAGTANYSYDGLNQLTQDQSTADTRGNITFTYDKAGNRLSQSFANSAGISYSLPNQLNRLQSSTDGLSYQDDNEGNLISQADSYGNTSYAWDGKNRLKKVTLPDGATVSYSYDANNHRVSRTQGNETRNYLYYGNQMIEESVNGQRIATYGYDGQGLISRNDKDGRSLYYLRDGLGSVMAIIDEDGNIVQSYEYSAYGECLSGKDSVNPFRFVGTQGGMQDDATGLTYFWNRWYDSGTGRWVSEDPIRQSGGINLFEYSINKPTKNFDPSGLLDSSRAMELIAIFKAIASGSDLNILASLAWSESGWDPNAGPDVGIMQINRAAQGDLAVLTPNSTNIKNGWNIFNGFSNQAIAAQQRGYIMANGQKFCLSDDEKRNEVFVKVWFYKGISGEGHDNAQTWLGIYKNWPDDLGTYKDIWNQQMEDQ